MISSLRCIAAAAVALSCAAVESPTPCCAYGGSGNAVLYTAGTIDLQDGAGTQFSETTIVADSVMRRLAVLVNGTTPEESVAGWLINEWRNSTGSGQTLTFWNGNTADSTPSCYSASISYPDFYVPGFHMCPGAPNDSIFPIAAASYTMPDASGVLLNVYGQPSGTLGLFTPPSVGCAPTSIVAMGSPLGNGAWTATVLNGTSAQPPAVLTQPPAYCSA